MGVFKQCQLAVYRDLKGSFKGDIDVGVEKYFGCLEGSGAV